ncbi:hypothetical protein Tco_0907127 [Tanacetum coccineum]|uniref:Uncharacterized protein n=1 Tax=Tanacetum coccineum TaxID=301880 RepID=A0ABQ5CLA4_9ASTR
MSAINQIPPALAGSWERVPDLTILITPIKMYVTLKKDIDLVDNDEYFYSLWIKCGGGSGGSVDVVSVVVVKLEIRLSADCSGALKNFVYAGTFECLWLHTLHATPRENEFESFSGQCLSEYIRQLILCPHGIQLKHFSFPLGFLMTLKSDVEVFSNLECGRVAVASYWDPPPHFLLSQYKGM